MKIELRISSSFLSGSACDMRNFLILISSLDTKSLVSNDIQFGSAFHFFAAEMIRSKGDFAKSLIGARNIQAKPCEVKYGKKHLSESLYLTNVVTDWWDWKQEKDNFNILEVDGEPLVEKSFKLTVYEDDDLIIYLCGTIDKIGKFDKGPYGIGDYKTTSKTEQDIYFLTYKLRVQVRTYLYAIMQHAKLYPDSVWAMMAATPLVFFIDGIFLSPPSKGSMAEFVRSEMFSYKELGMDEFEILLNHKVAELVHMFKVWKSSEIKPYRNGILEGLCDYCKFARICSSASTPLLQNAIIKQHYVTRVYDPLNYND